MERSGRCGRGRYKHLPYPGRTVAPAQSVTEPLLRRCFLSCLSWWQWHQASPRPVDGLLNFITFYFSGKSVFLSPGLVFLYWFFVSCLTILS
ncbi:uncharacterized protein BDW70DRAFT_41162 [Aspergillus foveolatus]|uniref:uncharacterized protein n=1 Tax=Aspergillus foveolatus TaxID=210207 RepID=UPI003CCDAED7